MNEKQNQFFDYKKILESLKEKMFIYKNVPVYIISIKEEYARKIFCGRKTVEVRKNPRPMCRK